MNEPKSEAREGFSHGSLRNIGAGGTIVGFMICDECKALVVTKDTAAHSDWHKRLHNLAVSSTGIDVFGRPASEGLAF